MLASNRIGRAFYSEIYADPIGPPNTARYVFFNPGAKTFFGDWQKIAGHTVGFLR